MTEQQKPDPMFDGHLEFDFSKLSTIDKLRYMSMQIELHHYIRTKVRRVSPLESKESTESKE